MCGFQLVKLLSSSRICSECIWKFFSPKKIISNIWPKSSWTDIYIRIKEFLLNFYFKYFDMNIIKCIFFLINYFTISFDQISSGVRCFWVLNIFYPPKSTFCLKIHLKKLILRLYSQCFQVRNWRERENSLIISDSKRKR